jgi:hypothetical protein
MIRINDTELNANGYISTDGVMSIEFESDSSLDEIAALFDGAKTAEVYDSYAVKSVDSIVIQGENPRKISVKMSVGSICSESSTTEEATEAAENAVAPTTLEEYADAVASGQMALSDVPADLRDKVAIKLGV